MPSDGSFVQVDELNAQSLSSDNQDRRMCLSSRSSRTKRPTYTPQALHSSLSDGNDELPKVRRHACMSFGHPLGRLLAVRARSSILKAS